MLFDIMYTQVYLLNKKSKMPVLIVHFFKKDRNYQMFEKINLVLFILSSSIDGCFDLLTS